MNNLPHTFPSCKPPAPNGAGISSPPIDVPETAKPIALTPYIVAVDDREKLVYPFETPLAEAALCPACGRSDDRPLPVDATEDAAARSAEAYTFETPFRRSRSRKLYKIQTARVHLATGDYSLVGMETRVAVERKSLADLFMTLGKGRARFGRELERLAAFEFAAVVVEAEWSTVLMAPPERSRLDPRTIFHSVAAWSVRYPRVHWFTVPGRAMGEVTTARLLDWFYRTYGEVRT
jgi:hypothetical protein